MFAAAVCDKIKWPQYKLWYNPVRQLDRNAVMIDFSTGSNFDDIYNSNIPCMELYRC